MLKLKLYKELLSESINMVNKLIYIQMLILFIFILTVFDVHKIQSD